MKNRVHITTVVPALTIALATAGVLAQVGHVSTYHAHHDFRLFAPAADTARVTVYDFRHVWVATNGQQDEDHTPPAQQPLFDPYGVESFSQGTGLAYNSGLGGGPVQVLYNSGQIPDTGSPGTPFCLFLQLQAARAFACNAVLVHPWTNQAPIDISGTIESYGYADAAVIGRGAAIAYAFSTAAIRIDSGITLANGTVQWTIGALVDAVGRGAGDVEIKDPVVFTATNLATGEVTTHTLVEVDLSHDGDGRIDIGPGGMTVDIPGMRLDIVVGSPVINPAQAGEFRLEVVNGVVQNATATGIYAGLEPPIGTVVPFTVPMPPITLDYDLGLDPTQPWEVSADLGGGGGGWGRVEDLGCPADLAPPFGILDLADVAAFVIGFVEQHPISDLDGNGIFDLADIGIFIESFISGCPDDNGGAD